MSKQITVFDKLVSELSSKERKELLQKIEKSLSLPDEPIHYLDEQDDVVNVRDVYQSLSLLDKFIILLRSLFTRQNKYILTEVYLVKIKKRDLEKKLPGYFSFAEDKINGPFCKDLIRIRQSVYVFRNALNSIFSVPQIKKEFYAFIGSLFLESFQAQLSAETDPWDIWRKNPDNRVEMIKSEGDNRFEQLFASLPKEDIRNIINNVRSLNILYNIGLFPFESVINLFPQIGENEYGSCYLYDIENSLGELINRLFSLNTSPQTQAVKAVFLFYFQDQIADRNFDLEKELTARLSLAKEAINIIRDFIAKYDLKDLMKIVSGNINYKLSLTGSGDDWLRIYREFWRERINARFRDFSNEREKVTKVQELSNLWGVKEINQLPRYKNNFYGDNITLLFPYTLGSFKVFFERVFPEKIYYCLNSVLIDGKFYKKENRKDFDDTFNDLLKFPDKIKGFVKKLDSDGEIAGEITRTNETVPSPSLRLKKITELFYNYDRDLKYLFDNVFKVLNKIRNLLEGILLGNGGPYDTLSNLNDIGGINNKQFIKDLNEITLILKRSYQILSDLYRLEDVTGSE